ncbi:50S ribosomal protein L15 [Thermosipho africanus H17ap60334]|jgi:large subunit ribosomal protein L15|uniref:Large ribosomal subunit protein uL15 n=1 Tax=Thermosipho africanus (strain TCF52B) TaxID=484019 RepID=RL15_THEAB|nr:MULTISPECIES: 50S ribosomal protein L15 [Thermosipho]B7IHW5.1 RecName: Full=Large ribosomal subunit protein uL15; AltName: Full=50S ribosomal protein L15 [Thermosipho africanus TCF52B]HCF38469.1 50S ribosomal protein L15 [Thermosipho africanus]ACJ75679.1 ribosomal protein L15 [Thermosipho africanus TCF52B]EKF49702.1 50S ribosomal protein L15 [Thermosipho africanus H17ap60334]MBZ4650541.1 rplO [Thermosipho sp. (in: thermotogales)]MDK2838518.1 large subunit ribosomal protein [Thermosipho sp.
MRLSDIRPTPGSMRKRIRVGRGIGSGKGKTSGKGHKGQKARGTGKVHPWFEGGQTPIHRRLPKFGFKNFTKKVYTVVNVEDLERKFNSGDEVTPEKLLEVGLIKKINDGVKILGNGEITKPLTVVAHAFSSSARRKIEAVGGKAEVI